MSQLSVEFDLEQTHTPNLIASWNLHKIAQIKKISFLMSRRHNGIIFQVFKEIEITNSTVLTLATDLRACCWSLQAYHTDLWESRAAATAAQTPPTALHILLTPPVLPISVGILQEGLVLVEYIKHILFSDWNFY